MTNSEKAREYAAEKFKVNPESKKWNITTTYMSACEWKDQQFREFLEKKQQEIDNEESYCDADNYAKAERIDVINEIINELFKED